MNWFQRWFGRQDQVETLTRDDVQKLLVKQQADIMNNARAAAVESVRKQFGTIHATMRELIEENKQIRKDFVQIATENRQLKSELREAISTFQEGMKKIDSAERNYLQGNAHLARKMARSAQSDVDAIAPTETIDTTPQRLRP